MSKSDKLTNLGAVASRSRSAQKVLDIERRFIDDPAQAREIRYNHFIWHLFVIAGTTCHFFAVLWYGA